MVGRAGMIGLAVVVLAGGTAIAARGPRRTALDIVAPGRWQLKRPDGTTRTLCIADPRVLLQLEHGAAQCSRFVIADERRAVTVHYTCPGAGHGQTTIAVESDAQFRLRTQGILYGAPFDTEYEGHRLGRCGGAR